MASTHAPVLIEPVQKRVKQQQGLQAATQPRALSQERAPRLVLLSG